MKDYSHLEEGFGWIDLLAVACFENSKEHGFWDKERNKGEACMLIAQEVAEMFEGIRKGNPPSKKIPEFTIEEEEAADILIRLLDYAQGFNLRLGAATRAKMIYNVGRERMHGKTC